MEPTKKKTPSDTTDFEREQLRFFLSREDVADRLAELNPSLAWLPELTRMKVIQSPAELTPWIEKNFDDPEAVRDVAANLGFFDERAADLLEFRLNRKRSTLSPLLSKSWQLIIRHIRDNPRGVLRSEWFDLQPRIKAGEHSAELLERLARVFRPKPKISKRISWYDEGNGERVPQRPSDLMSIDYEVEGDITESEVLAVWPKDAPAKVEQKLLSALTGSLDAALADALEMEVESNIGYGISDTDVPSVAAHRQNEYRSGFQPIVRIIAETWARLAQKDVSLALPFVRQWSSSPMKLNKRLALFAAADKAVPPDDAADVLLTLPQGLLFLTSASVEIFRLIRERWEEFSAAKCTMIEDRLAAGPPADWFRTDAEIHVDRSRFDILGEMERAGLNLGDQAKSVLAEIKKKNPKWELRPSEQAGFHIWHSSGSRIVGNPQKLQNVPVELLVDEAKKLADKADFMDGDHWQVLCQSDPQLALDGLEAKTKKGEWPDWAWNPFLWATQKLESPDSIGLTGKLLLAFPDKDFPKIASTASWWLNEKAKALDESLLWPLWDKIEGATRLESVEAQGRDALMDALNAPAGRLAEVLIKRMAKGEDGEEMPYAIRQRFDTLASVTGRFGEQARVRFAAEVSLLFERAPIWVGERIVPLFDWKSPDAANVWSARKYSNYIGSPKLYELTKASFLELFGRPEIAEDDLRVYGEWLAIIMIANRSENAGYPITPTEARSTLRAAGVRALSSVGHRLAVEMEAAKPEEKVAKWRDVVGPVFESIWPLDAELQSPSATFKLVQILRETGNAFPEAAEVIIPFVRSEDPRQHTSVFSISGADEVLYTSSPEKVLDLVAAVVGDAPPRSVYGLTKTLERIREHAPHLAATRKFQRLVSAASAQ